MSDLSSLPRGGKGFSPHRFKRKFKYLSENSKVVSPLSENQESIVGAVEKYQKFIRRGSFGKMQQKRAIKQIKSNENLGIAELRKVKKIIHKLGEGQVDEVTEPETTEPTKPKVRINRADPREELSGPQLARAARMRGETGLSDFSSSQDYNSAFTNRPLVSVNQNKESERGTGLSNPGRSNIRGLSSPPASSSRPSIPLSR
jgi:hypothetical protein